MAGRRRGVFGVVIAAAVGLTVAGSSQGLGEGSAKASAPDSGADGASASLTTPPSANVPSASPERGRNDARNDARASSPGHDADVVPPNIDDVQHMCALLTSCGTLPIPASLFPADFAGCVRSMHNEMSSARAVTFSLLLRECGLQSSSCTSLAQCALRGVRPDACTGRGKQGVVGFCDGGGRAVSCWHEEVLAVRDCPRGHEECLVVGGEARCSLGACPNDLREGDKARCSASQAFVLQCDKGKLATLDCSAFGLKCAPGTGNGAGCATGGPSCASNARRCEGDVAVACHNGHEVRVDCGAAGLVCEGAIGGTPVGACFARAPVDGGCDGTEAPRCDGARIRYCYAGKTRSYSCKAAGFSGCESSKAGVRCAK